MLKYAIINYVKLKVLNQSFSKFLMLKLNTTNRVLLKNIHI